MVVSAMDPKLFINMLHVTLTGGPAKEKKNHQSLFQNYCLLVDYSILTIQKQYLLTLEEIMLHYLARLTIKKNHSNKVQCQPAHMLPYKKGKKIPFEIYSKSIVCVFQWECMSLLTTIRGKVTFFTQGSFYLQCYLSSVGKEMHYCCSYLCCRGENNLDSIPISLKFTKCLRVH